MGQQIRDGADVQLLPTGGTSQTVTASHLRLQPLSDWDGTVI